ncbi:hypothetical protein EXIGLDRAFT_847310 [Exidia glandulosa HHB12029]|uniref:Uncharacterized protein n=1 Tax=Exidia glandulosa HHB12029 TaxID=1314781 RepID=A0A166N178_EXIGL|nr:hypothetical protein EXIGLDRAFT_847310 [Exidia glandulosa HHB12029]
MRQLTARSVQTADGIARLQQFLPRHPQVPGIAPSGMHAVSHSLPPPPVPPSRQYSAAPAGYGANPQAFSPLHSNGAYTPTTHLHPGVHIPSTPPTWNTSSYGAPPRAGGPRQSSPPQGYPGDAPRFWDPAGGRFPQ